MYKLKKEFMISCSHRLHNRKLLNADNEQLFGKCNNFPSHGHNYKIVLYLKAATVIPHSGMLMNFYDVKDVFKELIDDVYDHKFLNDCPGFEEPVPTAENMSKVFFDILKKSISMLYAVEIYETDGASAIYEED